MAHMYNRAMNLIMAAMVPEDSSNNAFRKSLRKEAKVLGTKQWYVDHFRNFSMDDLPLLHHAATKGATFLMGLLTKHLQVDVNSIDSEGATALHHAVLENQDASVQKLLGTRGIDVNKKDNGSRLTPFHLSIMKANNHVMKMLIDYASIDEVGCFGSPIIAAAFTDNLEAVNACLAHGADGDQVLYGFCNPLVAAVFGGSHACVALLVKSVQVTAKPLLYKVAAQTDMDEDACLVMMKMLVGAGADANSIDDDLGEELAIICAAKREGRQIIEFLLNQTEPIQGVTWTVDGLIGYVNGEEFKNLDREKIDRRITKLRSKMLEELEAKIFVSANMLLQALKTDLDVENRKQHEALCELHTGNASSCSYFEFSAKKIIGMGRSHLIDKRYDFAETAFMAALALEPNNKEYLTLLEETRRQERSGASR